MKVYGLGDGNGSFSKSEHTIYLWMVESAESLLNIWAVSL